MASVQQLGNRWRMIIRKAGRPTVSTTFESKLVILRWAEEREHALDKGGAILL